MHWPRGQKVKVTWYEYCHGRMVASEHRRYSIYLNAAVLPAAIADMSLPVDAIAYVF